MFPYFNSLYRKFGNKTLYLEKFNCNIDVLFKIYTIIYSDNLKDAILFSFGIHVGLMTQPSLSDASNAQHFLSANNFLARLALGLARLAFVLVDASPAFPVDNTPAARLKARFC